MVSLLSVCPDQEIADLDYRRSRGRCQMESGTREVMDITYRKELSDILDEVLALVCSRGASKPIVNICFPLLKLLAVPKPLSLSPLPNRKSLLGMPEGKMPYLSSFSAARIVTCQFLPQQRSLIGGSRL